MCACSTDNNETLALLNDTLHDFVKEPIDMEDLNQYAAIFDMDGLSWSDRSAQCRQSIITVLHPIGIVLTTHVSYDSCETR